MRERQKVMVDGVEVEAPADWTLEEVERRHRDVNGSIERTRTEAETLDHAAARRAIGDEMEEDPEWLPETVAFNRALADATEIAALFRAVGKPLTRDEAFALSRQKVAERYAEVEDGD